MIESWLKNAVAALACSYNREFIPYLEELIATKWLAGPVAKKKMLTDPRSREPHHDRGRLSDDGVLPDPF